MLSIWFSIPNKSSSAPCRGRSGASAFWSDGEPDPNSTPRAAASEEEDDDDDVFRVSSAHPAERRSFFDGTNGSSGIDHRRGEQHYHNRAGHRPRSPKIPASASSSKPHWKRDEEIREIFTLIDKVAIQQH